MVNQPTIKLKVNLKQTISLKSTFQYYNLKNHATLGFRCQLQLGVSVNPEREKHQPHPKEIGEQFSPSYPTGLQSDNLGAQPN